MTPRIETTRFAWDDPAAKDFFARHGYVIVRDVLGDDDRSTISHAWKEVVEEAAERIGLTAGEFERRFPQNRDLWRKSDAWSRLLFGTRQGEVAARFLGTSGVRLYHDHAIAKPADHSGTIPWHQDSAYWPLDRAGASLWTPVADVPWDGGCLKVLDGSHRDGPCPPQDFLAGDAVDRDANPRLVLLPVTRGETVVLHGLTWHGSDPNRAGVDRLAYLTLWVPATARFRPEHAGWHPSAAHVRVGAGERLDGEWFPLFGTVAAEDEGEPVTFPIPPRPEGASMFTAGKDIAGQIAWLLGVDAAPLDRLLVGDGTDRVVRVASAAGLVDAAEVPELAEVLADLALQERVRKESVARDVYLRTVTRWWRVVGARIAEVRDAA